MLKNIIHVCAPMCAHTDGETDRNLDQSTNKRQDQKIIVLELFKNVYVQKEMTDTSAYRSFACSKGFTLSIHSIPKQTLQRTNMLCTIWNNSVMTHNRIAYIRASRQQTKNENISGADIGRDHFPRDDDH